MITVYPYENLGHASFDWLDTRHHFSFGHYHNPARMGFGVLRVINDDVIKAGRGFEPHSHRDMEIITFVRKGAITHRDSRGNEGRTEAGDVQVMSAGTGIQHSEFNMESEDTTLFQIWIEPREKGVTPRWDAASFADKKANGSLPLLVSGREEDKVTEALCIHQDASIHGGIIEAGKTITHPLHDQAYLVVSSGEIELNGHRIGEGAGVEITGQKSVAITAKTEAQVIVIDVPAK